MLSSLSKYSPKNLLASYLAQHLALFFNVDPDRVETNLIKDAKVLLNDIEIKEKRLGGAGSYLKLSGSIKQIEFSWVWDSSALIKDVRLTVRGVSIHVNVIQDGDKQDAVLSDSTVPSHVDPKTIGEDDAEAPSDWRARYLQQVMDHLTVALTDATITIHHDDESVVLQANDMELITSLDERGNEVGGNLVQTLSLVSIEAWIEQDGTQFPVLEKFGYEACVTRLSGRRFLDGILGLLVEGKLSDGSQRASSTIRVHAGIHQIAGLNSLQQVLLLVGEGNNGADTELLSSSLDEQISTTTSRTQTKSIFHLPFQSMEVVLENETNVRLQNVNIRYSTDGSDFSIGSCGGIWVDNTPLSKDSRWVLDLVALELMVDLLPSQEGKCDVYSTPIKTEYQSDISTEIVIQADEVPVRIDLSLGVLKKIYDGIQAIMPQCRDAKVIVDQAMDQYCAQPSSLSTALWSMRSARNVAFCFTGASDSVEIVAVSPKVDQLPAPSGAFSFECRAVEVTSNSGLEIHVPQVSTDSDGCILVDRRIVVNVDSIGTLNKLKEMMDDIKAIIGDEPSAASEDVPFSVSLAGLDIMLEEPQVSTVHMSHITGSGTKWSIGLMQLHNIGNASLDASSIQVTLDANKTVAKIGTIGRLSYDKSEYLATPINGISLGIEYNGTVFVACSDVAIKYPDQAQSTQDKCKGPQEGFSAFPVSFDINVENFRIESSAIGHISIKGANVHIRPTDELNTVDLDFKSVKAKYTDTLDFKCGKISSSLEFGDGNDSELLIPGFGHISSTSMTIHDVTHLSLAAGNLSETLDVVKIKYIGQTATVNCNKIHFDANTDDFGSQSDGDKVSSLNLPITVVFEAEQFVAMQKVEAAKQGLRFDKLKVDLKSSSDTMLDIKAQCRSVQGRDINKAYFASKGVKLNLRKDLLAKDEFLGLNEAHLSVEVICSLSIPGQLKLVRPVTNSVFQLKNNVVDACCDSVHVSCLLEKAVGTNKDQMPAECVDIPVSFSITAKQIVIDAPDAALVCQQLSTKYTRASDSTPKALQLGVTLFNGKIGTDSYKLNGISLLTKWLGNDGEITIPYFGSLSFAQGEVEAVTEMTTSSFSLIESLSNFKILFQEGFLVLECSQLQLAVASDSPSDQPSKEMNLDGIRVPIGINISKRLRLKTSTHDAEFENVGIDYVCSTGKPEIFVHCDRLAESSLMKAKNIDLQVRLSLLGNTPKEKGTISDLFAGMNYLDMFKLKFGEITEFHVEGTCRLSQPLQTTAITYKDGVFSTDIDAIKVELGSGLEQSVTLKNLNLRIQSDPFDQTIRFISQSDVISGNGDTSFSVAGVRLITTIVPTASNDELLDSKPLVIPSVGHLSLCVLDISELSSAAFSQGHLLHPMQKLSVRFENDIISLNCPAVFLQKAAAKRAPPTRDQQARQPFQLPCKASISVGSVHIYEPSDHKAAHRETQCMSLSLTMEPMESRQGPGIGIQAIANELKNSEGSTVISIPRLSVSGLLQLNDLTTVGNLAIGMEKLLLEAEFSATNWSESLEKEPSAVIGLPLASIPKFDLTLRCKGQILKIDDATIACDEFQGSHRTTSSHIGKHYVDIVKRRIPYLVLAKTEICGANLGDNVGMMAGTILTGTSVAGATIGVAGRDMVGSALSMGKSSRGASASDRYKFGDFSRGIIASGTAAAKSGSAMRGDDSYQVGDISSGTAAAAANYATENRCRLAGAGGSTAGMIAGAALLGPVGFIAGSMLGGSAAKSSMAAITGDPKKDKQQSEGFKPSASGASVNTNQQSFYKSQDGNWDNDFFADASDKTNQTSHPVPNPPPAQSLPPNQTHNRDISQNPAHLSQNQANVHRAPATAYPEQQGYRFGDFTKGVVAKGKQADGRKDNSGYKFGDFSRGLFKK